MLQRQAQLTTAGVASAETAWYLLAVLIPSSTNRFIRVCGGAAEGTAAGRRAQLLLLLLLRQPKMLLACTHLLLQPTVPPCLRPCQPAVAGGWTESAVNKGGHSSSSSSSDGISTVQPEAEVTWTAYAQSSCECILVCPSHCLVQPPAV
jgi:hypothetical protein